MTRQDRSPSLMRARLEPPRYARLAAAAALVFYAYGAVVLWQTYGHYQLAYLVTFFASWVLAMGLALWNARGEGASPEMNAPRGSRVILYAWCIGMPLVWLVDEVLLYPNHGPLYTAFHVTGAVAAAFAIASAVVFTRRPRAAAKLVVAACAVCFVALVMVLRVSPAPHIDVFTSASAAADHLLAGRDPYSQVYADINGGKYDYAPTMVYWPAVLLWQTASRALTGDIRTGFIVADALACVALYRVARKKGLGPVEQRLVVLAWLVHPVAFLILEQSWVDTLLVMSYAWLAWSLVEERVVVAGVALGLAVSFKQYGVLGAAVTFPFLLRAFGVKRTVVAVGISLVVAAVINVPFIAWDAHGLYWMTIDVPGHQLLRLDSLSMLVPFSRWLPEPWPSRVTVITALVAVLVPGAWLAARKKPSLADWALAMMFTYGVFFFSKQAFCNYYQFESFFALLYGVCAMGKTAETRAA